MNISVMNIFFWMNDTRRVCFYWYSRKKRLCSLEVITRKKKKTQKQHRRVGLGHQHAPSTTQVNKTQAGRIGTSTQTKQTQTIGLEHQHGNTTPLKLYSNKATPLHSRRQQSRSKIAAPIRTPHSCIRRKTSVWPNIEKEQTTNNELSVQCFFIDKSLENWFYMENSVF